jgi:hypothetical protein
MTAINGGLVGLMLIQVVLAHTGVPLVGALHASPPLTRQD